MHIQGKLIERALLKSEFKTYGELADHLDVTHATMSQWRSGASKLPRNRMEQLAEISGDDPGIWAITLMAEESSVSTSLRTSIQRILKSSGSTIAVVLCAIGMTYPAAGKAITHSFEASSYSSMHIM